ncbi:MAG: carbon storage regulator CsrA [Proteobacteria bacterium]|nr:carbon storage regulator CsrA [Pseudomonadota bacterium]
MLVLTRKIGEGIAIGDDVKIVVMQIKGKQVRLGIKAAPSLTVHREEIYQKILDENRAASQPEASSVDAAGAVLGAPREVGHVLIKKHVRGGGQGSE